MSEMTRQLIVQTAERLGYFTKEQILSLRADRIIPYPLERKRFLLLQTTQSLNFYNLLLQGLHERFASLGHHIELLMLPSTIKEKVMEEWIELNGLEFTDGLFIAPSISPIEWEPKPLQLPVPKILLSYPPLERKWTASSGTYTKRRSRPSPTCGRSVI
jgi:LacI family transcriptional regulator